MEIFDQESTWRDGIRNNNTYIIYYIREDDNRTVKHTTCGVERDAEVNMNDAMEKYRFTSVFNDA